MKLYATFAACALAAAAFVGCETTEETTSVAPGAVSSESCCGTCGGGFVRNSLLTIVLVSRATDEAYHAPTCPTPGMATVAAMDGAIWRAP